MIIGVSGTIGSGKDTVANFFVKNCKFKKVTMSDFLRRIERNRKTKPTRDNLRKLQNEIRKKYGEEILMDMLLTEIVERNFKNVVIAGLRTSMDLKLTKQKLKAKIIFADAKPDVRFTRLRKRGRQGDPKNFNEFLHQDSLEMATFKLNRAKKIADFRVDNSKDPKTTEKQLKKIAKRLKIGKN